MKKLILLTLVTLMIVGCDELKPVEQLKIVNGKEYVVKLKDKNADDYAYCYKLMKLGQSYDCDYAYRDTSNYNVGDTLIITIKRK